MSAKDTSEGCPPFLVYRDARVVPMDFGAARELYEDVEFGYSRTDRDRESLEAIRGLMRSAAARFSAWTTASDRSGIICPAVFHDDGDLRRAGYTGVLLGRADDGIVRAFGWHVTADLESYGVPAFQTLGLVRVGDEMVLQQYPPASTAADSLDRNHRSFRNETRKNRKVKPDLDVLVGHLFG